VLASGRCRSPGGSLGAAARGRAGGGRYVDEIERVREPGRQRVAVDERKVDLPAPRGLAPGAAAVGAGPLAEIRQRSGGRIK